MTRDDVIKLAIEAGDDVEHTLPSDLDFLERFATIVAAAERDAHSPASRVPQRPPADDLAGDTAPANADAY